MIVSGPKLQGTNPVILSFLCPVSILWKCAIDSDDCCTPTRNTLCGGDYFVR